MRCAGAGNLQLWRRCERTAAGGGAGGPLLRGFESSSRSVMERHTGWCLMPVACLLRPGCPVATEWDSSSAVYNFQKLRTLPSVLLRLFAAPTCVGFSMVLNGIRGRDALEDCW